jgi:UDP-N-acetylmuramate dehydrogenase
LSDCCVELEYFDLESRELVKLAAKQCEFGYRDSVFKHRLAGRAIITSITLRLSKEHVQADAQFVLDYPQLKEAVEQQQALGIDSQLRAIFQAVVALRTSKLPKPELIPNAGSFFKNPVISESELKRLLAKFPNIVYFQKGKQIKLAAAWLIDQANWKSKSLNGVSVHQTQALVIVNPQRQSGISVLNYARQIQEDVHAKYGVKLEIEPRIYGF